jgi:multiple sugar transport system ATP-binding protein
MQSPFLQLKQLTRAFDTKVAVDGIDLKLSEGEFFVLLGPSGCGKTTTLRLVAGLDVPTSGEITLNGQDVRGLSPRDRNVAMVFQEHTLYPHMRIEENLGFSLRMQGVTRKEIRERVSEAAGLLGLEPKLKLWPHQLSGGEAQRVALGKALMCRPALLLLDEPLSNLDLPLRRKLRDEIRTLQRRNRTTTIHVTHDQNEAMALGDRIGIMSEGRLLQVGTPKEIYEEPNCLFSATFLGSPAINLIPGQILPDRQTLLWALGDSPIPLPPGTCSTEEDASGEIWAAFRPEDALVSTRSEKPFDVRGEVEFVQDMGHEVRLFVSCGNITLRVRVTQPSVVVREGTTVYLKINMEKVFLFRRDTGERIGKVKGQRSKVKGHHAYPPQEREKGSQS